MSPHKVLFLILSILLFCFSTNAQEAYKIGEISRIFADTSENPELNVAVEKMKGIPKAKLAIISYGLPGLMVRRMNGVKKYYEEFFNTSKNDLLTIYGGYENSGEANRKLRAELWIVPENAPVPKITPIYPKESYLFDEYYWQAGESGYEFDYPIPPQIFADFLKENPQNNAYIIYYGYRDKDFNVSLTKSFQHASRMKKGIIRTSKIRPSAIKVLSGGYSKEWAHIEFWIVPPGAKPPKPTLAVNTASNIKL